MSLLESLTALIVTPLASWNPNFSQCLGLGWLKGSPWHETWHPYNHKRTPIRWDLVDFNPERCCENPTFDFAHDWISRAQRGFNVIIFSSRGVCWGQPRTDSPAIISVLYLLPFLVHAAMKKFVLRLAAISVRDYDVLLAPFWPLFGWVQC